MISYDKDDLTIRPTQERDIAMMKDSMRKEEIDEVWASYHFTPFQALSNSFYLSSESYTVVFRGLPVAMFGLVPDKNKEGCALVWLLTSTEVEKIWIRFLKLSRKVIEGLRESYPVLYNYVDSRYEKSIKWIKWCGGEVFAPEAYGIEKLPFNYFVFGGR